MEFVREIVGFFLFFVFKEVLLVFLLWLNLSEEHLPACLKHQRLFVFPMIGGKKKMPSQNENSRLVTPVPNDLPSFLSVRIGKLQTGGKRSWLPGKWRREWRD